VIINGLFVIIVLIWIVVSQQVTYWAVITALGFRIETPLLFMEKDYVYFLVSWVLFLATVGLVLFQTLLAPWIQFIVVLITKAIVKNFGQKRACARYRQIIKEMRQEQILKGEDVSHLDDHLIKSDAQLLRDARERVKFGML